MQPITFLGMSSTTNRKSTFQRTSRQQLVLIALSVLVRLYVCHRKTGRISLGLGGFSNLSPLKSNRSYNLKAKRLLLCTHFLQVIITWVKTSSCPSAVNTGTFASRISKVGKKNSRISLITPRTAYITLI